MAACPVCRHRITQPRHPVQLRVKEDLDCPACFSYMITPLFSFVECGHCVCDKCFIKMERNLHEEVAPAPRPIYETEYTETPYEEFHHKGFLLIWVFSAFTYYDSWTLINLATGFPWKGGSYNDVPPPPPLEGVVRWVRTSKRWTFHPL